jgi:hypothetical protein
VGDGNIRTRERREGEGSREMRTGTRRDIPSKEKRGERYLLKRGEERDTF